MPVASDVKPPNSPVHSASPPKEKSNEKPNNEHSKSPKLGNDKLDVEDLGKRALSPPDKEIAGKKLKQITEQGDRSELNKSPIAGGITQSSLGMFRPSIFDTPTKTQQVAASNLEKVFRRAIFIWIWCVFKRFWRLCKGNTWKVDICRFTQDTTQGWANQKIWRRCRWQRQWRCFRRGSFVSASCSQDASACGWESYRLLT